LSIDFIIRGRIIITTYYLLFWGYAILVTRKFLSPKPLERSSGERSFLVV